MGVVFGIDDSLAKALGEGADEHKHDHKEVNGHAHAHKTGHQSEVEVLSITLRSGDTSDGVAAVDIENLEKLLKEAPRDEVYRISTHCHLPVIFQHHLLVLILGR